MGLIQKELNEMVEEMTLEARFYETQLECKKPVLVQVRLSEILIGTLQPSDLAQVAEAERRI